MAKHAKSVQVRTHRREGICHAVLRFRSQRLQHLLSVKKATSTRAADFVACVELPKRSNVVFWTRFAANDTVHFLAACFVETASFALQSAHFRNNAHVFRAKAHVRKTSEANGVVCRNDVQSTRLEPLGDTCVIVSIKMHAMHPNKSLHSFHRFNCIRAVKVFPVLKDSVYKAPCSAICLGVSWLYRPTRVEVNATVGQLKHLSKQLEDRRQSFPQRWGLEWPNLVEGCFIQT